MSYEGITTSIVIEVNEPDTDWFGHMNNANLSHKCKAGEDKMRAKVPLGGLFIYFAQYNFLKQIVLGELEVDSRFDSLDIKSNGILTHNVLQDGGEVAKAELRLVRVNSLGEIITEEDKNPMEGNKKISGEIRPEHIGRNGKFLHPFYQNFFEIGRYALQDKAGYDDGSIAKKGIGFLGYETSYLYFGNPRSGQKFKIISRYLPTERGLRLEMKHQMVVDGKVVSTAVTKQTPVNLETGRPVNPAKVECLKGLVETVNKLAKKH